MKNRFILGLLCIIMLSGQLLAGEVSPSEEYKYSIGISQSKMEYEWYGASSSVYSYDLTTIRAEIAHKSGFSIRYGYSFNGGSSTQTTITDRIFTIKFTNYQELELLYTYNICDRVDIFGGLGYYWQTVPIYNAAGSTLIDYDEDNDRGYSLGLRYWITPHFHLELFGKQTSKVGKGSGSCNQECIDNWEAKGSTIRSLGIGLNYRF